MTHLISNFTAPVAALIVAATTFAIPNGADALSHVDSADHGMLHVTKSPTCGCCAAWVALARKEGFEVEVTDTDDITIAKSDVGVPGDLWACHTATISGYVVEGHVPFAAIAQLLQDRPDVTGIAVPGMPMGSPGMGDDPAARFDVIAFGGAGGEGEVFFQAGP